jgi:hypothetical protein
MPSCSRPKSDGNRKTGTREQEKRMQINGLQICSRCSRCSRCKVVRVRFCAGCGGGAACH